MKSTELLTLVAIWAFGGRLLPAEEPRFSRDILPVLSDRCFHCHGPDEGNREAGLRLDLEEAAKQDLGGYRPIAPGNLEESEVWRRIASEDPDEQMPPPNSHRQPLTASEREAIRQWIEQGAAWGRHWAFEPPQRPAVPDLAEHPIDALILQRLEDTGLQPSPPAALHTQLRRQSFALTGMAPRPEAIRKWSETPTDAAWQEAVDARLASPQHAERMAMWWLDAARYSDSDGYQQDATRENWPWRDWVIEAFHSNMPFDQFTREQFAGDLLPEATQDQVLATCFHRNHMTNGEGGRDPEESRVDYVIDRVNTMGTVWMGLTLGCAQCHSHKFDPVSQSDYYSLAAFFNSIDETGKAGLSATPYLEVTSAHVAPRMEEQQAFANRCREEHEQALVLAKRRFEDWLQEWPQAATRTGYETWRSPPPRASSSEGTLFEVDEQHILQTTGPTPFHDDYRIELQVPKTMRQIAGWRLEVFPHESHVEGKFTRQASGEFTLTNVRLLLRTEGSPTENEIELAGAVADFESPKDRKSQWDRRYANIADTLNDDARDGWTTESAAVIEQHVGVFELERPLEVNPGDRLVIVLRHRSTHGNANIGRFRLALTEEPGETLRRVDGGSPLAELLRVGENSQPTIDEGLRQRLLDQFLLNDLAYLQAKSLLDRAQQQLAELKKQAQPRRVMVLAERSEPRQTHVLQRGVWDAKGQAVTPGILPSVLEWPAEDTQTRLDLANWLVSRDHPLTARVVVNQLWQIMFGAGLVRTPEDFGLQGELPTHPLLLDWLAVELMEHDWDVRHVLRLIATSNTFRQSSRVRAEHLELDPQNRLLARAPKYRLPAWMLRDNALHVSGLLNAAVGGPPVMPYQPEGIWSEITMGRFHYEASLGPAQYRRTLYAFWRRSSAPAFLFDSAQRRVCEVGMRQTNTPLQALTLLNDQTMLEAARVLADALEGPFADAEAQQLARQILSRELGQKELDQLSQVWQKTWQYYATRPEDACRFTAVGQQTPLKPANATAVAQTAAWMTLANLMLNLDEALAYE